MASIGSTFLLRIVARVKDGYNGITFDSASSCEDDKYLPENAMEVDARRRDSVR